MSPPTDSEVKAVKKLREMFAEDLAKTSEHCRGTSFILRFLRAQGGNVDLAEQMIRECLEWRTYNNADELFSKRVSTFGETNFPVQIRGHDRERRPLVLEPRICWKGMTLPIEDEEINIKYRESLIQTYERIMAAIHQSDSTRKIPGTVSQATRISDWYGVNNGLYSEWLFSSEGETFHEEIVANYPGIWANEIHINVRGQGVHSERHVRFGYDRSKWVPYIMDLVDYKQLPEMYGGIGDNFLSPPKLDATKKIDEIVKLDANTTVKLDAPVKFDATVNTSEN